MAKRRKAGEGTLTKRKDGRWEARVVVSYDEKGRPKTKNVTAVSKAKCLEKLEKLKAELGAVTRKCSPTMMFGEWMDFWYQTYCKNTLKESTQATYEQRIYKQIIPKLGHISLNQLNAGTLEKFYAQLKSNGRLVKRDIYGPGLANSVIRSIHAHCRAALEKAVAEKLIRQNPAIGCKLPPKKTPEVKILAPEAMQKLLYQAQIEDFYEMFMLDLATGLRRGEVVGLQWKDIDFETGTLSVTRQVRYVKGELKIEPPKTKASERSIILSPPVLEMLTEYRKTVDSIWLFPSPVKKEDVPRDPSACRKALARILKRAECEHVPFHAMRHTFASNAFHYGMDVKTLASTIGHESVETTLNVYAHSSEQMKRDAAKKIDEAIGTVLGADVTSSDASCGDENGEAQEPTNGADKPKTVEFKPYQPKYRKRGTGSVHQVSKNVWEGRYPNEYELLKVLALNGSDYFKKKLKYGDSSIVHLLGYRLIHKVDGEYYIRIRTIESYLKNKHKYDKVVTDVSEKRAQITVRRGQIEDSLRQLIYSQMKLKFGKKAKEQMISKLAGSTTDKSQEKKIQALDFAEAMKELYFSQLKHLMLKDWNSYQPIFNDRVKFEQFFDIINSCRIDAHAKNLDEEDEAILNIAFKFFENSLSDS